ncbi:CgeB family protein [Marininema halotolerans]|uniref:Spore maturation protein CgeB n=1 Tax=Marininema halotolerans TaxID=1155944 RepID=A0A1I6RNZ4_9BACL|nr:glycosyltransferase [Marininema halotolerans]SFS66425.1 spore maturation protein CgeB [Marininema halotolerans]
MRFLYIASGGHSYSDLDPNFIQTFRKLASELDWFHFQVYQPNQESRSQLTHLIRSFRPEVIISLRGALTPQEVMHFRKMGIYMGLWIVDDPYLLKLHQRQVVPYHFMVTQEASCVSFYRKRKKACFYLPLGVNEKTYRPLQVAPHYRSDICFVGSALPARIKTIDTIASFLQGKKFILVGRWWERLKNYHRLKHGIINQTIPPTETAKYYNGANIVLNIHRTKNDVRGNPYGMPANTPNNRTFDIAACRSFQLVSHRRDLHRFLKVGHEVVSYKGLVELKQKVHYYLKHPAKREQIAIRAYRRTLRDHTYTRKMRGFLHQLRIHMQKVRTTSEEDGLFEDIESPQDGDFLNEGEPLNQ